MDRSRAEQLSDFLSGYSRLIVLFDSSKIFHFFLLLKDLFIFGFTGPSLLCVPFL